MTSRPLRNLTNYWIRGCRRATGYYHRSCGYSIACYGFPQEMQHFVDCVQHDTTPQETGEDGRAVLEAIYAAYESARTGQKVALPYTPPAWATKPIYNWKPWLAPNAPKS
ncbi:MAG: Gfo/Idh/MocA family oxidoreductase [Armatimonadota bacterium]